MTKKNGVLISKNKVFRALLGSAALAWAMLSLPSTAADGDGHDQAAPTLHSTSTIPARLLNENLDGLCMDQIENRLWNIYGSDWAQYLRQNPGKVSPAQVFD